MLFCGDEGPEFFILGPLFDPFFDEFFFAFGERFGVAIVGGHGVVLVGDALPGLGVGEGVWDNGDEAVFFGVGTIGGVEAEAGLAVGFAFRIEAVVGSVARDALR